MFPALFCLLLLATTAQLALSANTTKPSKQPIDGLQARNAAFRACCASAGINDLQCCDYGLYTGGPTPPGAPLGELSLIQLQSARNCLKPKSFPAKGNESGGGGGSAMRLVMNYGYGGGYYPVGPPAPPAPPPPPPGTHEETAIERGEHVSVFVCMLGWKDLSQCCSKDGHIP